MRKNCLQCTTEFNTSHKRVNYCSRKCVSIHQKISFLGNKNPHWKGGKVSKVCNHCGNKYFCIIALSKSSRYCSRDCQNKYIGKSKRKFNQITNLSKEEYRKLYRKKSYLEKIIRKTNNPLLRARIPKIYQCLKCSTPINRKTTLGICKSCRPKIPIRSIVRKCFVCHKLVKRYKNRLGNFTYCVSCRKIAHTIHNPNWKGGIKPLSALIRSCDKNKNLIKKILARDNFTCKNCNIIGGSLEVDHIKKFAIIFQEFLKEFSEYNPEKDKSILFNKSLSYSEFWDEKNLQVLCKGCNWSKEIYYRKYKNAHGGKAFVAHSLGEVIEQLK